MVLSSEPQDNETGIIGRLAKRMRTPGFRKISDRSGDRIVYWWLDHWGWLTLPIVLAVADVILAIKLVPNTGQYLYLVLLGVGIINLVFLYMILRRFFNATTVMSSPNEVIIRRGPIPWPREFRFYRDDVVSVEVAEKFHDERELNKPVSRSYTLSLKGSSGRSVWLIKHLSSFIVAGRARDVVRKYLDLPTDSK